MTAVRETVDLRAEHEGHTMMSKCINAVHAGTYDNPACRTCACEWIPPELRMIRRAKKLRDDTALLKADTDILERFLVDRAQRF